MEATEKYVLVEKYKYLNMVNAMHHLIYKTLTNIIHELDKNTDINEWTIYEYINVKLLKDEIKIRSETINDKENENIEITNVEIIMPVVKFLGETAELKIKLQLREVYDDGYNVIQRQIAIEVYNNARNKLLSRLELDEKNPYFGILYSLIYTIDEYLNNYVS